MMMMIIIIILFSFFFVCLELVSCDNEMIIIVLALFFKF